MHFFKCHTLTANNYYIYCYCTGRQKFGESNLIYTNNGNGTIRIYQPRGWWIYPYIKAGKFVSYNASLTEYCETQWCPIKKKKLPLVELKRFQVKSILGQSSQFIRFTSISRPSINQFAAKEHVYARVWYICEMCFSIMYMYKVSLLQVICETFSCTQWGHSRPSTKVNGYLVTWWHITPWLHPNGNV